MSLLDAARYARWMVRHPTFIQGMLCGATLRDLVLREDLRRLGIDVDIGEARGLGRSDLSVPLVSHLREHLAFLKPRTVLDVGAEYGKFARAAVIVFPGTRVYSFEPHPGSFSRLRSAVHGVRGIDVFPFALGEIEEEAVLHRSRNPGSSSFLTMLKHHETSFPGTAYDGEVKVRVRTLDQVVAEGAVLLHRPVLLKIDVQGYEDRVLKGGAESLGLVDAVIIEMSLVPLYKDQILSESIRSFLEQRGFSNAGEFDRVVSPVTGEVCQVDGLFVRREGADRRRRR